MQQMANIQPLETRRNFKIQCQAEKAKRLLSYALHQKLNQPIKRRLQRKSRNYKIKELEKKEDPASQLPPLRPRVFLPIQRFEVSTKISGNHSKTDHPPSCAESTDVRNLRSQIPKTFMDPYLYWRIS